MCDTDGTTTAIPQVPSIDLVKTGTLDAGADGIAQAGETIDYTFAVTNTGNVTLTSVSVDDPVVGTVSCPDTELAPGESTTCTGQYVLTQADIDHGSKDNTATATGTPPIGDDVDDVDTETVEIPQHPAHTLVKEFAAESVNVGETSTFTLVYTNTGNVTLSDVAITDDVDTLLDVTGVTIADTGVCDDPDGNAQTVTCSVASLAPGESVTVTVTYTAAPLVDGLVPDSGQTSGANYVFYFENGYVLYGSTELGEATLIGPDGAEVDAGLWSVEGKNQDIVFNAPDGDSFQIHLSCSQVFIDGYGDTGPTEADNPDWKIDAYQVHRFNTNGFFKDCGQIFAPFEVVNIAYAEATPAGGDLTPNPVSASDTLTVQNPATIEVTRNRVRKGDVEIQYFNNGYDDLTIDIIRVEWTDGAVLESASYLDGVDLGISGGSPANASTDTLMPARSKDWLKLSFNPEGAPEGLTVTIVTSTGATLTYVYP